MVQGSTRQTITLNIKIIIIIIMTKTIKLFLPNQFYEELLYQYEDKDADLRKLVFGFLTPLGKQGKMVALNGAIQAKVMREGKIVMDVIDLKDVDLDKFSLKSDPSWIPEKVTKDEIKTYSQQISDRLYDDIVYFGKVFCARLELYNNSLDKKAPDYKQQIAIFPACIEQVIQDNIVGQLSQALAGNIDKEYNEEFAEMEKKLADKKPPKRK